MEITKPEVAAIEQVEVMVNELNELELALVGGGVGEVVLA